MKKYLVVGDPINHSFSPQLHNYWFKENNINGIYEKEKLKENGIKELIRKIKNKEINGANITVPLKKKVIPHLDQLTLEAEKTQSVNTTNLENNKIVGHNTDIGGFKLAIKNTGYDIAKKKF